VKDAGYTDAQIVEIVAIVAENVFTNFLHRASDRLTDNEVAFIAARDSFYIASVSESGWPYVQHRGGPAGFLKTLDDKTLGFADFRGNRQYISLGNVAANDRVSLILVDYPIRARLKLLARMQARDLVDELDIGRRLTVPGYKGKPERAFVLHLESFDWNCPQHIVPRYTLCGKRKLRFAAAITRRRAGNGESKAPRPIAQPDREGRRP
jgi:predicted pyridoxine 5'-phosphate oxidase superfamily flavin-nucleotide-binding protein